MFRVVMFRVVMFRVVVYVGAYAVLRKGYGGCGERTSVYCVFTGLVFTWGPMLHPMMTSLTSARDMVYVVGTTYVSLVLWGTSWPEFGGSQVWCVPWCAVPAGPGPLLYCGGQLQVSTVLSRL
jgi:hypothetical protein